MVCSRQNELNINKISLQINRIENVNQFQYLGSNDGRLEKDKR